MDIWDAHCHLSGVPGRTPVERLGQLLEFADRMGIQRLCVFMGMEWDYDPSPEKMRRENDEVNVSVDLSGGDAVSGMTEMAVRELGAERVLFGSDAGGRSFASQLGKVFGARVPESAQRLILAENLKRLLKPILRQKGVSI